ncbi:hypothetical protein [Gordonia crocea]|uniref:Uncharacterized protein n=1 Tax=Gordonia crocea TaxID=589162 RepID=A0A7M3SUV6_9ACTN|nr:hypothetical protein [Gordonia crocea]GED96430.1 hypothetical protein nbrc107697_04690 [Gordonia crocea]
MARIRIVGHVGWWVFVVACLFRRSVDGGGIPRRYADYLPAEDFGWTAYVPLTDSATGIPDDGFAALNTLATITVVALAVTVLAALAQAWLGRDWPTGAITVVTPLLGGYAVLVAGHGGVGGHRFSWWILFGLALLGVAIREVWSRGFAPSAARRAERVGEP